MKILFLCVGNSSRSQMAEGLAREIFGENAWIESAGSKPSMVNPYAIQVMEEDGIDISRQTSKSIENLSPQFLPNVQYVITLCAEEVCPTFLGTKSKKLHWEMPDPANGPGNNEEKLTAFRNVRDAIREKLQIFAKEMNKAIEL